MEDIMTNKDAQHSATTNRDVACRDANCNDKIAYDFLTPFLPPSPPSNICFVTLTYAQTRDGVIGTRSTDIPLRISGIASMRVTHALRASHDAILVGAATALADDPQLTTRFVNHGPHGDIPARTPIAVFIDPHARLSVRIHQLRAVVARKDQPRSVLWIVSKHDKAALTAAHHAVATTQGVVIVVECPSYLDRDQEHDNDEDNQDSSVLDMRALTELLVSKYDVHSLMVEGGSMTLAHFAKQRVANALIVTTGSSNAIELDESLKNMPQTILAKGPDLGSLWSKTTRMVEKLFDDDSIRAACLSL